MKLYATIKTERAEKSQGGNNHMDIYVKGESEENLLIINIVQAWNGDQEPLEGQYSVFINNRHYTTIDTKGEKKKGDCDIDDTTEHLCIGVGCKNR